MMSKYDQLAGRVADLISQVSDIDPDKLTTTSNEYTEAVGEINERLRKAVALLHKGLRDEAIQECEREPNLLDAFEALDIHDPELWRTMHRTMRIPLPPPLLLQQAAELNGAYALQAPLTELLRKHRLLALGHAPLAHRIQMLRQISQKDPTSEVWHTDIKAYETERIAEIKSTLSRIRQTHDLAAIQSVYRELNAADRIVAAPDELKTQVAELLHQFEIDDAREKLRKVSNDLQAAFSEFDLQRGFELEDQWELYLGPATLPPDHELLAETQPTLDWLAEQQRELDATAERENLLASLMSLLDNEAAERNELETTYNRLSATGTKIEPILVRRYRNRIQTFQTKEKRSQTLKLVGILGTIAIFGGAVFFGIRGMQTASKINEAVSLLNSHRQQRQWQDGIGLIDTTEQMSPNVFQSTSFQNERLQFQKDLDSDRGRTSNFESLTAAVRIGGVTIEDSTKISEMEKIAITAEEKQQVNDLRNQMTLHDAKLESDAREKFNEQIAAIDEAFRSVNSKSESQLKNWLTQIEQARTDNPYALRGRQNAGTFADLDEVLENRINAKIETLKLDNVLNSISQDIDKNVGRSFDVHIELLEKMARTLNGTEPAKAIQASLTEKPHWLMTEELNKALKFVPERIEQLRAEQIEPIAKSLQELRTNHKLPPQIEKLEHHFDAVRRRATLIRLSSLVPEPIRNEENAALVEPLLKMYEQLGTRNRRWEVGFRNAMAKIYSDETANPIHRMRMYEVALDKAIAGSWAYETAFDEARQRLKSTDKSAILQSKSKEDAKIFMKNLPHAKCMKQHIAAVQELRMMARGLKWVGWITSEVSDDGVVVKCSLAPGTPNGDLCVLLSTDDNEIEVKKLGSQRNGKPRIDDDTLLQIGRPVFWKK